MVKAKSTWWTGAITVLVITTGCILLVITAKGLSTLMTEENCNESMGCVLQPWWQLSQQPTPTPPSTVSVKSTNTATEPQHAQLKRDEIRTLAQDEAQNNDQTQEMNHEEYTATEEIAQEDGIKDTESENDQTVQSSPGCLANGDCGLGYECFEGSCRPGCSKHQDCPHGYECRYGRWGHRCFEKKGWHRECRVHLSLCSRHLQCCSGYCGSRSKGKVMMCRPTAT